VNENENTVESDIKQLLEIINPIPDYVRDSPLPFWEDALSGGGYTVESWRNKQIAEYRDTTAVSKTNIRLIKESEQVFGDIKTFDYANNPDAKTKLQRLKALRASLVSMGKRSSNDNIVDAVNDFLIGKSHLVVGSDEGILKQDVAPEFRLIPSDCNVILYKPWLEETSYTKKFNILFHEILHCVGLNKTAWDALASHESNSGILSEDNKVFHFNNAWEGITFKKVMLGIKSLYATVNQHFDNVAIYNKILNKDFMVETALGNNDWFYRGPATDSVAVNMYNTVFNQTYYNSDNVASFPYTFKHIPIENNFFIKNDNAFQNVHGTTAEHPEMGRYVKGNYISQNNRFYDNVLHPGFGSELMVGFPDTSYNVSLITLGFLQDLGWNIFGDSKSIQYYDPVVGLVNAVRNPRNVWSTYWPSDNCYNTFALFNKFEKEGEWIDVFKFSPAPLSIAYTSNQVPDFSYNLQVTLPLDANNSGTVNFGGATKFLGLNNRMASPHINYYVYGESGSSQTYTIQIPKSDVSGSYYNNYGIQIIPDNPNTLTISGGVLEDINNMAKVFAMWEDEVVVNQPVFADGKAFHKDNIQFTIASDPGKITVRYFEQKNASASSYPKIYSGGDFDNETKWLETQYTSDELLIYDETANNIFRPDPIKAYDLSWSINQNISGDPDGKYRYNVAEQYTPSDDIVVTWKDVDANNSITYSENTIVYSPIPNLPQASDFIGYPYINYCVDNINDLTGAQSNVGTVTLSWIQTSPTIGFNNADIMSGRTFGPGEIYFNAPFNVDISTTTNIPKITITNYDDSGIGNMVHDNMSVLGSSVSFVYTVPDNVSSTYAVSISGGQDIYGNDISNNQWDVFDTSFNVDTIKPVIDGSAVITLNKTEVDNSGLVIAEYDASKNGQSINAKWSMVSGNRFSIDPNDGKLRVNRDTLELPTNNTNYTPTITASDTWGNTENKTLDVYFKIETPTIHESNINGVSGDVFGPGGINFTATFKDNISTTTNIPKITIINGETTYSPSGVTVYGKVASYLLQPSGDYVDLSNTPSFSVSFTGGQDIWGNDLSWGVQSSTKIGFDSRTPVASVTFDPSAITYLDKSSITFIAGFDEDMCQNSLPKIKITNNNGIKVLDWSDMSASDNVREFTYTYDISDASPISYYTVNFSGGVDLVGNSANWSDVGLGGSRTFTVQNNTPPISQDVSVNITSQYVYTIPWNAFPFSDTNTSPNTKTNVKIYNPNDIDLKLRGDGVSTTGHNTMNSGDSLTFTPSTQGISSNTSYMFKFRVNDGQLDSDQEYTFTLVAHSRPSIAAASGAVNQTRSMPDTTDKNDQPTDWTYTTDENVLWSINSQRHILGASSGSGNVSYFKFAQNVSNSTIARLIWDPSYSIPRLVADKQNYSISIGIEDQYGGHDNVTVPFEIINLPPTVTGILNHTIVENVNAGIQQVETYTSNEKVNWTLGGSNASDFSLNGQLDSSSVILNYTRSAITDWGGKESKYFSINLVAVPQTSIMNMDDSESRTGEDVSQSVPITVTISNEMPSISYAAINSNIFADEMNGSRTLGTFTSYENVAWSIVGTDDDSRWVIDPSLSRSTIATLKYSNDSQISAQDDVSFTVRATDYAGVSVEDNKLFTVTPITPTLNSFEWHWSGTWTNIPLTGDVLVGGKALSNAVAHDISRVLFRFTKNVAYNVVFTAEGGSVSHQVGDGDVWVTLRDAGLTTLIEVSVKYPNYGVPTTTYKVIVDRDPQSPTLTSFTYGFPDPKSSDGALNIVGYGAYLGELDGEGRYVDQIQTISATGITNISLPMAPNDGDGSTENGYDNSQYIYFRLNWDTSTTVEIHGTWMNWGLYESGGERVLKVKLTKWGAGGGYLNVKTILESNTNIFSEYIVNMTRTAPAEIDIRDWDSRGLWGGETMTHLGIDAGGDEGAQQVLGGALSLRANSPFVTWTIEQLTYDWPSPPFSSDFAPASSYRWTVAHNIQFNTQLANAGGALPFGIKSYNKDSEYPGYAEVVMYPFVYPTYRNRDRVMPADGEGIVSFKIRATNLSTGVYSERGFFNLAF